MKAQRASDGGASRPKADLRRAGNAAGGAWNVDRSTHSDELATVLATLAGRLAEGVSQLDELVMRTTSRREQEVDMLIGELDLLAAACWRWARKLAPYRAA